MSAKRWLNNFKSIDYKCHIVFAFLLRLLVIVYGHYHDRNYSVAFTDVDYKVFTDAARYTWNGSSPYNRHTYRYTPIIAFLLIPNILFHNCFGKVLFCFIDVAVAFLIRSLVISCWNEFAIYKQKNKVLKGKKILFKNEIETLQNNGAVDIALLLWLYNPLTITIAARGNCDSLAALLVIATLYLLQCKKSPLLAGIVHGLAIHVRLYPIVYSLSFFMFLSSYSVYSLNYYENDKHYKRNIAPSKRIDYDGSLIPNKQSSATIFKLKYLHYLIPNFDQLKLIFGCLFSLGSITTVFYLLYGKQFLQESLIYHLIRKDTRHNFSLYFYLQYLTANIKNIGIWQNILTVVPQLVLLLVFSVRYGLNRLALNFCVLVQTLVMVSFNTVVTSQYFVWILSVLPICFWQINMSIKLAGGLLILWFGAQGAWLLPAYLLEFQGINTFLFIWIQSVSFFCANITILGRLIKYFMFDTWESKLM